ncbi:hypothetical protein GW750_03755 [bacterium]|nr:hypothetical protein [bacterium]
MTRPLSSYIIAVSLCSLLLATSVLNAAHASLFDTPDSSGSTQTITVSQSAYLNNPQYKKALTTFKALNSKLQVMARQKDMTKKEFFVKIA